MNEFDFEYLQFLSKLIEKTEQPMREDRTQVGTYSIFGQQLSFDLKKGFPLITSKKMFPKSVIAEALWFMKGSNDIRELSMMTYGQPNKKTIWTDNAIDAMKRDPERFNGRNLGNMYGIYWRYAPCNPHGSTQIKRRTTDKPLFDFSQLKIKDKSIGTHVEREHKTNTSKYLYQQWQQIIKNCLSGNYQIVNEWLDFDVFLSDCYTLFGFQEYVDGHYRTHFLTPMYFGSTIYSPETCIFLSYTALSEIDIQLDHLNLDYVKRPIIYIDQLKQTIDEIKNNPNSRRLVVDGWNYRQTSNAVLGVCHPLFQFYVDDGKLSTKCYIRSNDTFLGMPYNISSYAFITYSIAKECDLKVDYLYYSLGDAHLYSNHVEQAKEQLSRSPIDEYPQLSISDKSIFDLTVDDVFVENYNPHPTIKAVMAV